MSSSCDERRRRNTKQKEEQKSFPIFPPSNFLFFPMMFLEFQFLLSFSPPVGCLSAAARSLSSLVCVGLGQFTDCSKYFYPMSRAAKNQDIKNSKCKFHFNYTQQICVFIAQLLKPKMNSAMHVERKREMENYFDNKFSSISIFGKY